MPPAAARARDKIVRLPDLVSLLRQAQDRGEVLVFTNGCFDLLHVGHLRGLEAARALGDRLIVGVNQDESVRALKGTDRPILSCRERMELLAGLACVDWVVSFAETTPARLIDAIRPDVLAKGGDWKKSEIVGAAEVESWGGRVERLPLARGRSTTGIIERIRERPARAKR